ncbi:hypothetical protein CJ739_1395 [Mariniflexile rhizosphaerae]|uniref:hypothetical protein n=1 Tax=unclassified Mariniflexile TaxID=2643887 RepID=UPI000E336E26|nr:hypothetical protein [Mariniflexile sp. TRM1-10]AXP80484.1 hypothetical protein CJ739_1395 [Mariniflexile sp. TRM1-10]
MKNKSFWPNNIKQEEHKSTPKEILTEQIGFLTQATNRRLQGTLSSVSAHSIMDKQTKEDFSGELFIHSMKIISPSLGYSFTLLRLAHGTLKIYPFAIYSNLTDKKYIGENIDDVERILTEIFNSKEVVDALNALSSQSDEYDDLPF